MKHKFAAIIYLVLAILMLAVSIYWVARPISYGMGYYTETEYQGTNLRAQ